jgi:diguanylate cyclase (GGDEF)-like protein
MSRRSGREPVAAVTPLRGFDQADQGDADVFAKGSKRESGRRPAMPWPDDANARANRDTPLLTTSPKTASGDGQTPVARPDHDAPATGGAETVFTGFGRRITVVSFLLLILVSVVAWQVVRQGQARVIEFQAREVAEVITHLAASGRSAYAQHVAEKLRVDGTGSHMDYERLQGYIPLPAQFLKLMGKRASDESNGLFRYQPISKWNLEPTQGLKDDFQRWAWDQLAAQDQEQPAGPIDWRPVWRIEPVDGNRVLRYMRADPASAQSCVDCHNAQEQAPEIINRRIRAGQNGIKRWQLHQLLGAIEVNIPLDKVEALAKDQMNYTMLIISGVVVAGMVIIGFFVFVDVTQARTMARQLTWQAGHDALTELHNRHKFEQRLSIVVQRAKLDHSTHALIVMDLDQFKIINDACGHDAGDTLLRQLGAVLKSQIRGGDTLARIGGDEFGILLENCSSEYARRIAESLRQAAREFRFSWGRRTFEIGVSVGMVSITQDSESVSSLLSAADVACHMAKAAGRNRIHMLHPSDAEMNRHRAEVEWASGLNRAIEEGRLRLVVQDAVQLPERVDGKRYQEILLRMIDDKGDAVPTGTFISAAERFNLMPTIDRWVVRNTFALIHGRKLTADANNVVAINVSGTLINDEDLVPFVQRCLNEFPVPTHHICFEITETAAIRNLDKAAAFIQALKAIGFQFALDDFGVGSSSFAYLKNLSVDYLKIDGSFVRDIGADAINRAMVEAVAKIGRVVGIATVAEWVETEAVLDQVRSIGLDYAQGFAIARPRALDVTNIPGSHSLPA